MEAEARVVRARERRMDGEYILIGLDWTENEWR